MNNYFIIWQFPAAWNSSKFVFTYFGSKGADDFVIRLKIHYFLEKTNHQIKPFALNRDLSTYKIIVVFWISDTIVSSHDSKIENWQACWQRPGMAQPRCINLQLLSSDECVGCNGIIKIHLNESYLLWWSTAKIQGNWKVTEQQVFLFSFSMVGKIVNWNSERS